MEGGNYGRLKEQTPKRKSETYSYPVGTRLNRLVPKVTALLIVCLWTGCWCKEDEYGERLDLIVPVTSTPNATTFRVGDTLYWHADFSKEVEVRGHTRPIRLDDFDFSSSFALAEIGSPDTVDFNRRIVLVPMVGQVGEIFSDQNQYPVRFRETEDAYQLSFGVILLEEGFYTAGLQSFSLPRDFRPHPAAFKCGGQLRGDITINFQNSATERPVFDTLYLQSPNPDIQRLADFERYRDYGGITFRVVP